MSVRACKGILYEFKLMIQFTQRSLNVLLAQNMAAIFVVLDAVQIKVYTPSRKKIKVPLAGLTRLALSTPTPYNGVLVYFAK